MKKLTYEQVKQVSTHRICITSYPWPKGKNFDSSTADEMNEIRKDANLKFDNIAEQQKASGGKEDTYESLVRRYGDLLYMLHLKSEGRFNDMVEYYKEVKAVRALSREDVAYDQAEESTYYTRSSLDKLITVLNYFAIAHATSVPHAEVVHALESFIASRDTLVFQMKTVGDPFDDLMTAVGCPLTPST